MALSMLPCINMEASTIYFDHASTSFPKPDSVTNAVASAMTELSSAGRGFSPSSLAASRLVHHARTSVAAFLGLSNGRQIAFTSGATEGLNLVIEGLCSPNEHVLTTVMEHNSVLRPLAKRAENGLEFDCIGLDADFCLDVERAEQKVNERTKVLMMNHASNVTGSVNDLAFWGAWAKSRGLLFVVDASQSAGLIPIDMQATNIDVLCCSGHKSLYGPQGIGCIAVSEGVELKPWKVGGSGFESSSLIHPTSMPDRLEAGTLNIHGIAGLVAGLEFLERVGQNKILAHGLQLRSQFVEGLSVVSGMECLGVNSKACLPVVSFVHQEIDTEQLASELAYQYGVVGRSGLHCAPFMHRALGTFEQGGTLRFSFSHFNHAFEIDHTIEVIQKLCKEIKQS